MSYYCCCKKKRLGFKRFGVDDPATVPLPYQEGDYNNNPNPPPPYTGPIEGLPTGPVFPPYPPTGTVLFSSVGAENIARYSFNPGGIVGTLTTTGITDPQGGATAGQILMTSILGTQSAIYGAGSAGDPSMVTLSAYIQSAGTRYAYLYLYDGLSRGAVFDVIGGTVVGSFSSKGSVDSGIVPYPNGWFRCWFTSYALDSGSGDLAYVISPKNGPSLGTGWDVDYTGTPGIGINFWRCLKTNGPIDL